MRINQRSLKSGLPPGSIIHIGERKRESVDITLTKFASGFYMQKNLSVQDVCNEDIEDNFLYWINIDGLQDTQAIEKIGQKFDISNLVLEDITNTEQRPKTEDLNGYLHVILKTVSISPEARLSIDQVSIIAGKNYVLSFTEDKLDSMQELTRRIEELHNRFFEAGTDFLAYSIIDGIVDNYFFTMEDISDKVEMIEKFVINSPSQHLLEKIYDMKKELLLIQRNVRPLRDVINSIVRSENPIVKSETLMYYRDVYDHVTHVVDTIDVFRDMIMSLVDIYLSSISKRMNEVMKVLTIISTIFMPLTFIAGIYGMNFKYMPELEMHFGYPIALCGMFVISLAMVYFFKKKNWF